jgi:hypothetical protein
MIQSCSDGKRRAHVASLLLFARNQEASLRDIFEFAHFLVMRLCILACTVHVMVFEVGVVGRNCRSVKKEQKEKQKKRQQWKERSSRQEQDKQSRQAK